MKIAVAAFNAEFHFPALISCLAFEKTLMLNFMPKMIASVFAATDLLGNAQPWFKTLQHF